LNCCLYGAVSLLIDKAYRHQQTYRLFDGVVTQKTKIIPYSFHQTRQQLIKTSQFNSNHSTKESAPTDAFTLAAQKAAAKRQEAQDETGRARRSVFTMGPWETWESHGKMVKPEMPA
jgi:hypothetical protein